MKTADISTALSVGIVNKVAASAASIPSKQLNDAEVKLIVAAMRGRPLSKAERDVFSALLFKGSSNKEVAQMLGNAEKTIKYHLTSIFKKCNVKSRWELLDRYYKAKEVIDGNNNQSN